MRLNALGQIAKACWISIPDHFPHVCLDAFVIMLNHMHGLLSIVDSTLVVGAQHAAPLRHAGHGRRMNVAPQSLGAIVRSYKSAVTKRVNTLRRMPGAPVWQRNYYARVVRDAREANRIRRYIAENPLRWHRDRYHPDRAP